MGACLWFIR